MDFPEFADEASESSNMRIAYFDCTAGASGSMILGSLVDARLSVEHLRKELARLCLAHYEVQVQKVTKNGMEASQVLGSIAEDDHHHPADIHEIQRLIESSELDDSVKRQSISIFHRLAEARTRVHRTAAENVRFREGGAIDAVLSVVGSVAGLSLLGVEKVYCSPLPLGSGTAGFTRSNLPVPSPVTAELIKGKPVYTTGARGELLTTTGAAILTTLASDFGPMPLMSVEKVGHAAGTSNRGVASILRVMIGQSSRKVHGYQLERVAVAETDIDDADPQTYSYLIQRMLEMGALDVFLMPMHMKENRPGNRVTVICAPERMDEFSDFLMRETDAQALQWRIDNRIKAERSITEIRTNYGPVKVKIAEADGKTLNASPEYEDCKRIALEQRVPLKELMEHARMAASDTNAHSKK